MARRHLHRLISWRLLQTLSRDSDGSRGRAENAFCLSKRGVDCLRSAGVLSESIPHDCITYHSLRGTIEHQLLLNWFWIHLLEVEKNVPDISIKFLSSTSPFDLVQDTSRPFIYEAPVNTRSKNKVPAFTPDGVFALTSGEHQMTMLFFAEIDRGTEIQKEIREKISNYQMYFRDGRHKKYENLWQAKLKSDFQFVQ